jgi:hypothetical protein
MLKINCIANWEDSVQYMCKGRVRSKKRFRVGSYDIKEDLEHPQCLLRDGSGLKASFA